MDEDATVANEDDDERQQHADDDEKDGVAVGCGAVPQTLLRLGVETVRRPAKVVRRVYDYTDQPREHDNDGGVTASKHRVVRVVPADVQVAVDCDERDGE